MYNPYNKVFATIEDYASLLIEFYVLDDEDIILFTCTDKNLNKYIVLKLYGGGNHYFVGECANPQVICDLLTSKYPIDACFGMCRETFFLKTYDRGYRFAYDKKMNGMIEWIDKKLLDLTHHDIDYFKNRSFKQN